MAQVSTTVNREKNHSEKYCFISKFPQEPCVNEQFEVLLPC